MQVFAYLANVRTSEWFKATSNTEPVLARAVVLLYQSTEDTVAVFYRVVLIPITKMTTKHATDSGIQVNPIWIFVHAIDSGLHCSRVYDRSQRRPIRSVFKLHKHNY